MDSLKISEKDKVLIAFNKTENKYIVKEVAIHDNDLATLFIRAKQVIEQLNAGRVPYIAAPDNDKTANYRYKCEKCGSKDIPAFPESPENTFLFCPKCRRWNNFKKVI